MKNFKLFNSHSINKMGVYSDNLIGAPYTLYQMNAKDLSEYLKDSLKSKGIDYNQYNSDSNHNDYDGNIKKTVKNPPVEIYEYQNFFLMEDENDEYILLDGFRRLLWYTTPETSIFVRVYEKVYLSNIQIFTLMLNLNHFKFFGAGSYFDRGFALLFKTIYNLNILNYSSAFNGYLSGDDTHHSYGGRNKQDNETIKKRILNPFFTSDIAFIEHMHSNGHMVNEFVGALLFKYRLKTQSIQPLNYNSFVDLLHKNPVYFNLLEKYQKYGTTNSAKSHEIVNLLIEIYENIFKLMDGGEAVKSYSETLAECKALSKELQKDKKWTKLTGSRNIHVIETMMNIAIKNPKSKKLEFKCVVYPNQNEEEIKLPYGLNLDIKFLRFLNKRMGGTEMLFGIEHKDGEIQIRHNYAGSYASHYGKKYVKLDRGSYDDVRNDIDLFVNISSDEIKDFEKRKEDRRLLINKAQSVIREKYPNAQSFQKGELYYILPKSVYGSSVDTKIGEGTTESNAWINAYELIEKEKSNEKSN